MTTDAFGNKVYDSEPRYVIGVQRLNAGQEVFVWAQNPNYIANSGSSSVSSSASPGVGNQSAQPPHLTFTFDTIGQTIVRSIGHCRLALKLIWVQGINASGDTTDALTVTFAAALCAPIDPTETGAIAGVWNGSSILYDPDQGGVIIPDGMDATTAALLQNSIDHIAFYPGDEFQLPDPTIQGDKGVAFTNAFRGIRYIVVPAWPAIVPINSLSLQFKRTNSLKSSDVIAVEFAAGAG